MDYGTNFNNKVKYKRSFTLLETIVAIYVLLSGIVGAMTLAQENLKALSYFRDQLIAANLAQEAAELVRNKRDSTFLACIKNEGKSFKDCNTEAMKGLSDCMDNKTCRIKTPLDQTVVFQLCAADTCRLGKNSDGIYGGDNVDFPTETKYTREIKIKKIKYNGTINRDDDWHVEVTVRWKHRLIDAHVAVNDVLTPGLRY